MSVSLAHTASRIFSLFISSTNRSAHPRLRLFTYAELYRKGDSCCLLEDGKLVVITNIIRSGREVVVCGNKFRSLEDFYNYPIPSSLLGIYQASSLLPQKIYFSYQSIKAKYIRLPLPDSPDKYLCLPLSHHS